MFSKVKKDITRRYDMALKILLVAPSSPFILKSGGQQRTALLYEALSGLGQVDVLLLGQGRKLEVIKAPDPRVIAEAKWCKFPLGIAKYRPNMELTRKISEYLQFSQYDLIVGRYLNPICKLQLPQDAKTIVDLDDWDYEYDGSAWWTIKGILTHIKSSYARMVARQQLKRFNAFFFVSERDKASVPAVISKLLPNIPFLPPVQPFPQTGNKNILFVGTLWYGPNRQGIEYFLKRCWPGIRANVQGATLKLVGDASPSIRTLWEKYPDVRAPGFVDDLDTVYRDAAFTIAPIHNGGGTNIKIIESLAYGRACVTTLRCANAFGATLLPQKGIVVADNDIAWVSNCTKLLLDQEERTKLAECGHKFAVTHYTKTLFIDAVTSLVNEVIISKHNT